MSKQKQNTETKKTSAGTGSVTPEPLGINLGACALTIKSTCGDCRHFKRMAHSAYGDICEKKGILSVAKPCARFHPDPRRLNFHEEGMLPLMEALAQLPTSKLPILAAIINREHRTRRRGFQFGEVVYIRAFGGDYISNYRRCRVISAEKELINLAGAKDFTASVTYSTVLTYKMWKIKKAELEVAKQIKDPNYKRYFGLASQAEKELAKFLQTKVPTVLNGAVVNKKILLETDKSPDVRGKKPKDKNLRATPLDKIISQSGPIITR